MSEPKKLDSISVSDFRNLEEAPLAGGGEENDPLHQIAPSGESLEDNTAYEQGNKFGGQTQRGTLDFEDEAITDDSSEPRAGFEEILETDLEDADDDNVHSPEASDMNLPGEIDIETLDEDALDETDLPPDARLDPLED